jgi:hypothetical protein
MAAVHIEIPCHAHGSAHDGVGASFFASKSGSESSRDDVADF